MNCTTFAGVTLDTKVSDGCRKVNSNKVVSARGYPFGAHFALDASQCNKNWIIVISVIVPLVILGVTAAVFAGMVLKKSTTKNARAPLRG